MMSALIRKDLYTQKASTYLLGAVWFIIFTNFFTDGSPVRHVLLLIIVAGYLATSSNYNTNSFDRESILVNSLPVTRSQVVHAKYAAGLVWFVAALAAVLLYILLFHLFAPFPSRMMTMPELLIALGGFAIVLSIFYPLHFKLGYNIAATLTIMLPIIAVMTFVIIGNIMENPRLPAAHRTIENAARLFTEQQWLIAFGFLAVSAIFTWLSLRLSRRFYNKADFDHA